MAENVHHGGYELIARAREGSHEHLEVIDYLSEARAGLVADLGPKEEDLTAAEVILIDRIITKLGILRCIEKHISKKGIFEKGGELRGTLKSNYLAYDNSVTRALSVLGVHTKKVVAPESLADIIRENKAIEDPEAGIEGDEDESDE